ncbi:hypothetical protein C8R42DRAFT_648646 [Lentinula raphanica]|nr:hypothetical protein C8R42DRAFT_648646 [Lentinula raphanica]
MPTPPEVELDPKKYPSNQPRIAAGIRKAKGTLTLRFEGDETTVIEKNDISTQAVSLISQFSVAIKNESSITDDREHLSYGRVRGIRTKNKQTKVLVTWFLRSTEIKKCLRENGCPSEIIDGLSNNEFVETDIEGIVNGGDIIDLAGLHLLTDDIEDEDFHLLTAKAFFYRPLVGQYLQGLQADI